MNLVPVVRRVAGFRRHEMAFRLVSKPLIQVATVLMIGTAVSACSSVPGWVDPTSWIGGGDSSDVASSDQGLPADQAPDQQVDDQTQGASGQPGLAYIPDRPQAPSTPQERQQVADSLAADRNRQQYSGEQLRGDKQNPNPAPAPQPQTAMMETAPAASPTMPATAAPAVTAAPQQYASSGGPPAVPASTSDAVTGTSLGVAPGDAQLGFQPSKAPPLDPSVAQFVPPSILARYQQTATVSPDSAIAAPTQPAVPAAADAEGMGGPETMTGAVVANLDAIQPPSAVQSAYANPAGLPPAQVVFFPHDTTVLNAEARKLVRAAADTFRGNGGQGFIRVVGHSSSRTGNMPLARHLELNFERSQARATAVAKELIRDGVPAEKVLVEAVGDSQPVYFESMPQGEEGNRRAEIFIQG
jgi:outer membrane protein OmpA-like peptidoglycan-associated protein